MKRIHILSTVNAANVSRDGDTYRIKDVCGARDGIVMNGRMYPGDELAAGVATLEGKPAPAGHPMKNGHFISALNGAALASAWIGSYCTNARHEGGKTLVDIEINSAQAKAHPQGSKLIERLDAAIAGTNSEPINVSTGLNGSFVTVNGESMGKRYSSIVTNIQYDHLAILLDQKGAATPADGVGMFLNSAGEPEQVETASLDLTPADRRNEGLTGWIRKLLGNSDLSFSQIDDQLRALLPENAWPREVFPKYFVWTDYDGNLFKQDYSISSDNQISLTSTPEPVVREVEYKAVKAANSTPDKGHEAVKEHILAALNQAGISVTGLDDNQLLSAYNSLISKPHTDALAAANAQLAEVNKAKADAEAAELNDLASKLAVNSALTVDDLKALPVARLRELAAKAAPITVGNTAHKPGDEFANYSLNKALEAK